VTPVPETRKSKILSHVGVADGGLTKDAIVKSLQVADDPCWEGLREGGRTIERPAALPDLPGHARTVDRIGRPTAAAATVTCGTSVLLGHGRCFMHSVVDAVGRVAAGHHPFVEGALRTVAVVAAVAEQDWRPAVRIGS